MIEKTIELTGSIKTSREDGVSFSVSLAAVTVSGREEFEVTDINAIVEDGAVARWKVKTKQP